MFSRSILLRRFLFGLGNGSTGWLRINFTTNQSLIVILVVSVADLAAMESGVPSRLAARPALARVICLLASMLAP